jgi:hypothetical protein
LQAAGPGERLGRMACGVSTVARLVLLTALATGACRKSESEVDPPPRIDGAASPSGMAEDAATFAADSAAVDAGAAVDAAATDLGADAAGELAAHGKFKPRSGDFGSVAIGQSSAPQTFAFTNEDEQPAGPLATRLGGPDAPSFVIVEDRCQGATLPAAETCSVTLSFKPQKTGELAASLTLTIPGRGTALLVIGGTGQ